MQQRLPDPAIAGDLNPEQRAAVTHDGGPCLVLAGAGSGKTRVITHRIAWLIAERGVPASSICALTFTNKAAAEMRGRVREILGEEPEGLWLLTFHALGLRLLRGWAGRPYAPRAGFAVCDRAAAIGVWRACQQRLGIDAMEYPPRQLFEIASRGVNRLEDPRSWDAPAYDEPQRYAARVFGRYRGEMERANAVDFDDLLVLPLRALADKSLRESLAARFDHLLVDEYQDTNRLQYRLIRGLLPASGNLMVVGDEDQAIYRWRGADIANVLEFRTDFPDATVVRLERNYRSTQPILAAASSLVAHNRERLGKELRAQTEGGAVPSFTLCASERDEAVWVAKQVAAAARSGVAHDQMAILYRTNAQSRPFEEELAGRGIPFRVVGGPTFFRRAAVRDIMAWLRLLVGDDEVSFRRAATTPPRGVGDATLDALSTVAEDGTAITAFRAAMAVDDALDALRRAGCTRPAANGLVALHETIAALRAEIGRLALPRLVARVRELSGYAAWLSTRRDAQDRREHLDEVEASAEEFAGAEAVDEPTLSAFLDRAALVADADTARGRSAGVALTTIHAAKGLEFATVFVVGLEEGLFPHASALNEGTCEEERRLCYVAMTRARRELHLTAARARRLHGRERYQQTSRFVREIDARCLRIQHAPGVVSDAAGNAGVPGSDTRLLRRGRRGRRAAGAKKRPSAGKPPVAVPVGGRGTGVRAEPEQLAVGAGVFHPMFGPGRITRTEGASDQLKLTIRFARAGTKQVLARFAKLELLA